MLKQRKSKHINGDSNFNPAKLMPSCGLSVKQTISSTMTLIKIGKLNFTINDAAVIKTNSLRKSTLSQVTHSMSKINLLIKFGEPQVILLLGNNKISKWEQSDNW
jgi:hypothetical protein